MKTSKIVAFETDWENFTRTAILENGEKLVGSPTRDFPNGFVIRQHSISSFYKLGDEIEYEW